MKKTFLTLLLLFIANFSIAQDASNDATWEETVQFINENVKFIKECGKASSDKKPYSFYIEGEELLVEQEHFYGDDWRVYESADLKKLKEVTCNGSKSMIFMDFTGAYLIKYIKSREKGRTSKYEEDEYKIKVSDSEMHKRLLKAFQHLAYLATEKRKEEIKKSGSKF